MSHIPGDNGWPIFGNAFAMLGDPKGFFEKGAARHGLVMRDQFLSTTGVNLLGPAANEFVFLDKRQLFSNRLGWVHFSAGSCRAA